MLDIKVMIVFENSLRIKVSLRI